MRVAGGVREWMVLTSKEFMRTLSEKGGVGAMKGRGGQPSRGGS